ncbi:chemotaxis protein MotB [Ignatzschineria ureiclastica]|uniref:Chemotaxis protein MotB n=1 Tax=Ignatzschineria ureiclastica TaxID=472582 RepID=A0A2U2ACP8_9GAMM|nr:OmpA family protein [Ignatzschineria ureiclastica]PWD80435.1 chemotaxis protein MotB [Ignatzschineria ureiclastica]GGZ99544.1 chemotaxis protein MotB [Ignatzschineria ureiclastica]
MRRIPFKKNKKRDEENPYWMSFSDMMSALLMVFILASIVLILQLMERQKAFDKQVQEFNEEILLLKKAEEVRKTILIEVAQELKQEGINVEISENYTVLRIPNELLGFDTGAYEILPRYADTAQKIGETLYRVINKEDRLEYLDTIFIEGHTDKRPLSGLSGKGNWGLSTFRSISLWQFWNQKLPDNMALDRMLNKENSPLFSVSGYGETRPVIMEQITEEDYKKNRRIDIRFTIRRPDSTDYEAIKAKLGG